MDAMNVSRSGRIRKKSSKLADFESPDEIEAVNPGKKSAKPHSQVMTLTFRNANFHRFVCIGDS